MKEEVWRQIQGYEFCYEVSSHGRVRSVSRYITSEKGRRLIEGRILSQKISNAGYPSVYLSENSKGESLSVHRLVAKAFVIGDGAVVRHMDGVKTNNHYSNLQWGTHQDNEKDKLSHGTKLSAFKHPNCKINIDELREIRRLDKEGFSQTSISKHLGIGRGTAGKIIRGESWGDVL